MQQFTVTFSRSSTVWLIIAIVPVAFCLGIVMPLGIWPDLSDWTPLVLSVATVAVAIPSVVFLYRRYAAIPAEVELDERGIRIRLQRPSPFYKNEYAAGWDGIRDISSRVETQHSTRYYRITFRESRKTVQLMPEEYADETCETAFGGALMDYIALYKGQHTS